MTGLWIAVGVIAGVCLLVAAWYAVLVWLDQVRGN
jgi:hypothetical protein